MTRATAMSSDVKILTSDKFLPKSNQKSNYSNFIASSLRSQDAYQL